MSVKTTSERVTRAMRAAIRETISPANQGSREPSEGGALSEAGRVSRQFGHDLNQHFHAYTGWADSYGEFGGPGNTVDNWRLQFSQREGGFKPANGSGVGRKGQS